jgi:hypothetical protein
LTELLRKPVLHTEPDAVRKLKMFYQTCISAGNYFSSLRNLCISCYSQERDSLANENATYNILIYHLERIGGFPALHGNRWQPKLSLERLLATLHLEFNIEPLFELKVAADDMNNTQHIILVIVEKRVFIKLIKENFRLIIHRYFYKHQQHMNRKKKLMLI